MHSFTLLSLLSASLVLAAPDLSHRHQHRELAERQGQGRPNMNNSWSEPPISSSTTVTLPSPSREASSSVPSSSATTSSQVSSTSSAAASPSSVLSSAAVSPSATSAPAVSSAAVPSSSAVESSAAPSSDVSSPTGVVPTISVPSSATAVSSSIITVPSSVVRSSITSIVTATRTASSSSSATAAAADAGTSSSGGLSKPALIAIIVVASVVGVAAIGFTLFRRWKLRPSNRFDEKRLNAINFAPAAGHGGDDFFEKSHNRSASASSAERHRKALMAEEFESGPALTAGIPEHDFTAGSTYGMAGAGAAGYGAYNADPFAHAQAYDYQSYGEAEHGYPPQTYDQYGHPVAAAYDHPTQDSEGQGQGYADLQRGNSDGSAHQHSHAAPRVTSPTAQVYHDDLTFPESGQYLGRPTGGADGPYAQAAQYRSY